MKVDIVVPQVGEAVAEVILVEWLKNLGDLVKKGEVLYLVDTDKAIVEVEAFTEGVLAEILTPDGSVVMPRQVVGKLMTKVESIEKSKQEEVMGAEVKPVVQDKRSRVSPIAAKMAASLNIDLVEVKGTGQNGRIMVEDVRRLVDSRVEQEKKEEFELSSKKLPMTPKARQLAKRLDVNIADVDPTGINSLITAKDIEKAAIQRKALDLDENYREVVIPYSKRRHAIVRKMTESKKTIPHFYLMVDVNMTNVVHLRSHCVEVLNWKRPPTYTDIIVRACALAISKMPEVNVIFSNEGAIHRSSVDIGIAVGLDEGLIVPVLSNADQISLKDTSRKMRSLIARVNEGRLRDGDFHPKSMVVSNLGMYDVDAFVAIIDIPDPMILAVGRVQDRVVPLEGQPIIAPYCSLTLSIDHRALDGVLGAKFLQRITGYLNNPFDLLN